MLVYYTMAHDKLEISNSTRECIVNTLVEPYYKDMVKTTMDGKKIWRILGISLETSSKIMVALGGIFSFSAGFYHDYTLSFVSGSISCMSLALLQIASFSYKENKKQGEELNILLKKLNLDTIPTMVRTEEQTTIAASRYTSPQSFPIQSPLRRSNSVTSFRMHPIKNNHDELKQQQQQQQQQNGNGNGNGNESHQHSEYDSFRKEYEDFVKSTHTARSEIQNLDRELDEKLHKIQEREDFLNERERESKTNENVSTRTPF